MIYVGSCVILYEWVTVESNCWTQDGTSKKGQSLAPVANHFVELEQLEEFQDDEDDGCGGGG